MCLVHGPDNTERVRLRNDGLIQSTKHIIPVAMLQLLSFFILLMVLVFVLSIFVFVFIFVSIYKRKETCYSALEWKKRL